MKKKEVTVGIIGICMLCLAACKNAGETTMPTITSKPKVMIVDAATPTPTVTFKEEDLPAETQAPVPTLPEVTKKPIPTPTIAPTVAPTSTPVPTATPVPTQIEKQPYEKGILTDTEFKSEWMGMKFAAAAGIELSTQEELDETMRLLEEAVTGKEIEGALDYKKLGLVYEMSLVWQDKGLTMQVMVERMVDGFPTEEDYVTAMREEMSLLEENGFTYIVDDKTYQETIAGKEFINFGYTTYYDVISLHQENYIRKQDDRVILISIMGESEEGMQDLLELFKAY